MEANKAIAQALAAFAARASNTVADAKPGSLFAKRVQRDLMTENMKISGEVQNTLADVVKALKETKDAATCPSVRAYYDLALEEVTGAMDRIHIRHLARLQREADARAARVPA